MAGEHTIQVEKILPADPSTDYPICLIGKRACPPENVGGIWGYEDILKSLPTQTMQNTLKRLDGLAKISTLKHLT